MIIYVHGYASTGGGGKYDLLKAGCPDQLVLSPTLPVDPEETVQLVEDLIHQVGKNALIVGTSLGGFFAYYFAAKGFPAVVINPTLVPWDDLQDELGHMDRFDSHLTFEWRQEYLDKLKKLGDQIDESSIDPSLLHFFLSTDDELLDHSALPAHFPDAAMMKQYDHCTHRFARFAEILPDIRSIVETHHIGMPRGWK